MAQQTSSVERRRSTVGPTQRLASEQSVRGAKFVEMKYNPPLKCGNRAINRHSHITGFIEKHHISQAKCLLQLCAYKPVHVTDWIYFVSSYSSFIGPAYHNLYSVTFNDEVKNAGTLRGSNYMHAVPAWEANSCSSVNKFHFFMLHSEFIRARH
jgi:hypothetical protein